MRLVTHGITRDRRLFAPSVRRFSRRLFIQVVDHSPFTIDLYLSINVSWFVSVSILLPSTHDLDSPKFEIFPSFSIRFGMASKLTRGGLETTQNLHFIFPTLFLLSGLTFDFSLTVFAFYRQFLFKVYKTMKPQYVAL